MICKRSEIIDTFDLPLRKETSSAGMQLASAKTGCSVKTEMQRDKRSSSKAASSFAIL
jgi:hypothetical protein